ncbi:MAG TPA: DeoR family transcriptional regulator, partial [Candidatus Borkfalkia excrementavium]|nr:DeoR family transcriptional regulator [Candidatus Borkfalkia excrementavium]
MWRFVEVLSEERYQKITERVGRNGSATVNELASECGVSIETIRRDLVFLE